MTTSAVLDRRDAKAFGRRRRMATPDGGTLTADVVRTDDTADVAGGFELQPTLRGELLELRPLRPDDFPLLFAVASDPLIWEQHPARDRCREDVFREFFREATESGGALIATDRRTGEIVGSSRFNGYDAQRSEIEIGWTFLARSHWGGRYNGEMKRLMLDHAFRFVKRVIFVIGVGNRRSQAAVEKIGASRVGTRTAHGLESYVYEIVNVTNTRVGQIVAMGGGGFSMEPDNPLLDDFVLSLAPRQPARVCFVPTASADSAAYIVNFYRAFSGRCIPSDLTLFASPLLERRPARSADLASFVAEQDVIYVGGGSAANLLALWRAHGLDVAIRHAWLRGSVLCGVSAGMLCWFSAGLTDSYGGLERFDDGLALIQGAACPHYGAGEHRRRAFHRAVAESGAEGYAADDGAALRFVGSAFAEAVSSRPEAGAYRVARVEEQVVETRLPVRFLGAAGIASVSISRG
jgi:peptidase E/RimJ/RimL family protein N-acetyltransferase